MASSSQLVTSIPLPNASNFLTIKLDRTNFPLWQAQMLPLLRSRNLVSFVDGTRPCPPAFLKDTDGNTTTTVNPDYETWIQQDATVMSWINSSVHPTVLAALIGKTSSHSGEGSGSRFSHPSGRPTSTEGNLMVLITTGALPEQNLLDWVALENVRAFRGVVTMVVFTPWDAKNLAISEIGIMWPSAMKGNKKMWNSRFSLPMGFRNEDPEVQALGNRKSVVVSYVCL